MISLPFIIAGNAGNYKGILISANLYNNHHNGNGLSGSLVKRKKIFITNDNNLRQAVERMVKENIESLPVISGENNHVVGELSYRDILANYKHKAYKHEKKQPHISLKREGLKILVSGKKIVQPLSKNNIALLAFSLLE